MSRSVRELVAIANAKPSLIGAFFYERKIAEALLLAEDVDAVFLDAEELGNLFTAISQGYIVRNLNTSSPPLAAAIRNGEMLPGAYLVTDAGRDFLGEENEQ